MEKIKIFVKESFEKIKTAVIYDDSRREIMFLGLNVILALVSFVMSVVNFFTSEYILMAVTLAFCIICFVNFMLIRMKANKSAIYGSFGVEALLLLTFFFISGIPAGFSALWVCLVPSFALLFFGRRKGSLFCGAALLMMIILFWTPFGNALLRYEYSRVFMLRFPFLYLAIYGIAFMVEYVRSETQKQLVSAEQKYRYMYCHDALTGLYNRYGFNELIDRAFSSEQGKYAAVLIFDIDDFKNVNDKFGHSAGDKVLCAVADIQKTVLCDHCQYCRWGGEEFMVLMQCKHDPVKIAEKIRKTVQETVTEYENSEIRVTVSLGVCVVNDVSKVTIPQAINQVDKCLYQSKENGKNKVTSYVFE